MCGITGGYNVQKEKIETMVHATAHRGPDATGFDESGDVIFGHNRLAIIDTSALSNQPMKSPDGRFMLVFNGEIYNFKELKKQLTDWQFRSEGDSEVLLAALATWGDFALNLVEGIFAFGFYDKDNDTLMLVRDHMGVKPLYYIQQEEQLLFSSELKGVLAGLDSPKIDLEGLSQFLNFNYVPSPKTLVAGVNKLSPGHWLKFKDGTVVTQRYFQPIKPSVSHVSKETIRDRIGKEVTAQLVSDRPVGVLLSGGFDSSIVLHHATANQKMKTFSTSFEMSKGAETDYEKFNADAAIARRTATHYGADHTEFAISLEMIRQELVSSIEALDEPISNPVQIPQLLLTRFVREKGIVVALGGDGGDELWGGYIRHTAVLAAQYFQYLPKTAQRLLGYLHPRLLKLSQPLGAGIHLDLTTLNQTGVNRVLKQRLPRDKDEAVVQKKYEELALGEISPIEQFMRADRELWLADDALQRTDRSGMASGVEIRVPLLGLPVVNFADSIFAEKKFNVRTSKKILKRAYYGHIPSHLYNQPKRGWMAPGAKWMRDEKIELIIREVCSDNYYDGLSKLIDWNEVHNLLSEHVEGKGYHLNPVWNLLVLQIWARKFNVKVS